MSMSSDRITCTGCSFVGVKQYRPISLVYRLRDDTEVKLGREFGWCNHCEKIRDIEPRMDVRAIGARIEELRKQTRSGAFLVGNALNKLLGGGGSSKKEELASLEGQLRLAELRRSRPRCLACGNENTQPVRFNEQGLSENFVHDCGGRLRVEPPDLDAPRFSFKPETIFLNEEGQRLQQGVLTTRKEEVATRDLKPDLVSALTNQAIGGQSVMYRMFREALLCDDAAIRRMELTYLAAAVMTYVVLRFGRQPNRERILDEFTRRILEKSLPASREELSFDTAVREHQQRFAEYSGFLDLLFTPEKSTSGNPAASLLMHAFQSVTRDTARGHMIVITAASGLIQQFVIDHIEFVKEKL